MGHSGVTHRGTGNNLHLPSSSQRASMGPHGKSWGSLLTGLLMSCDPEQVGSHQSLSFFICNSNRNILCHRRRDCGCVWPIEDTGKSRFKKSPIMTVTTPVDW